MTASSVATFWLDVRVYYEDTDAAGVVYYANYLRFMERARTEWLHGLGCDVAALSREHGVAFAVHRLEIATRGAGQRNTARIVETVGPEISDPADARGLAKDLAAALRANDVV